MMMDAFRTVRDIEVALDGIVMGNRIGSTGKSPPVPSVSPLYAIAY
jgi:hypothetical protein